VRIVVGEFSPIVVSLGKTGEKETRIRFSVTFSDDDGPLVTQQGYTIAPNRTVRPPMSRTKFGTMTMAFTQLTPRFEDQLRQAVLQVPDVAEILGPEPPEAVERRARMIAGKAVIEPVVRSKGKK